MRDRNDRKDNWIPAFAGMTKGLTGERREKAMLEDLKRQLGVIDQRLEQLRGYL